VVPAGAPTNEKRNASGQLVKAVIFEGDRVLGTARSVTGEVIEARLRRGWLKGPDHRVGDDSRLLERPKMPSSGRTSRLAFARFPHQMLHGGRVEAVAQRAAGNNHRAVDTGEAREGWMAQAAFVYACLVLTPA